MQNEGYELLQSDESLFSVDGFNSSLHWSHTGQPILKPSRWASASPVVIFGVISPERGVVHWHFGEHSFNAQDILEALKEVRAKSGTRKLAMLFDNARIHRSRLV